MLKIKQFYGILRSSFWFVPLLLVACSVFLAVVLVEADSSGNDRWLAQWPRLFGAGSAGSRGMLSAIAGSMMSVIGVTFSMTLVALALASSQYTSRILRNFMRSKVTQYTFGTFAGIFAYCLIVLRTIRGSGEVEFIPGLAVFFACVLALGSIGVLIYFIHHIATSIQASTIISSVARETIAVINRLFPKKMGHRSDEEEDKDQVLLSLQKMTWRPVPAKMSGYIQNVDNNALLRLAMGRNTILRMERGVGDFVIKETALAALAQTEPPDQETITAVNSFYSFSSYRTIEQDPSFGIRQIVDIALKALSPGVNDTSTAVMCIDYLAAIVAQLATRQFPSSHHYEENKLRVITVTPTFDRLLAESFDQIRRSAEGNIAIMLRMLGALEKIAGLTTDPQRLRALNEQVQWLDELAGRTIAAAHDRARIERRLTQVRETLEAA